MAELLKPEPVAAIAAVSPGGWLSGTDAETGTASSAFEEGADEGASPKSSSVLTDNETSMPTMGIDEDTDSDTDQLHSNDNDYAASIFGEDDAAGNEEPTSEPDGEENE